MAAVSGRHTNRAHALVLLAFLSWWRSAYGDHGPPCFDGLDGPPYRYTQAALPGSTTQQPDAATCQAHCAGVPPTPWIRRASHFEYVATAP
eukprot:6867035-Pyramimonas_sp.AAC.1